jgi:hypothetical protein
MQASRWRGRRTQRECAAVEKGRRCGHGQAHGRRRATLRTFISAVLLLFSPISSSLLLFAVPWWLGRRLPPVLVASRWGTQFWHREQRYCSAHGSGRFKRSRARGRHGGRVLCPNDGWGSSCDGADVGAPLHRGEGAWRSRRRAGGSRLRPPQVPLLSRFFSLSLPLVLVVSERNARGHARLRHQWPRLRRRGATRRPL